MTTLWPAHALPRCPGPPVASRGTRQLHLGEPSRPSPATASTQVRAAAAPAAASGRGTEARDSEDALWREWKEEAERLTAAEAAQGQAGRRPEALEEGEEEWEGLEKGEEDGAEELEILTLDAPEQPEEGQPGSEGEGEEDDGRGLALLLARVASDTRAQDVQVLHVARLCYWTSYLVLATVFSRPQLNAVLGRMERAAAEEADRASPSSGSGGGPAPPPDASNGAWEVLDYGDVVVHVFTPELREFYALEDLYSNAKPVELPFSTEDTAPSWRTTNR